MKQERQQGIEWILIILFWFTVAFGLGWLLANRGNKDAREFWEYLESTCSQDNPELILGKTVLSNGNLGYEVKCKVD